MRMTPTQRILTLIIIPLITCFSLKAQTSTSGTCSSSVYLGTKSGGVCVGEGFCHTSADGGVNATFVVVPNNPNILMMIFSYSDLSQKQPDQLQYFANGGSYMFDAAYNLSADPVFAPLNLPANSQITPTSPSLVEITGDIVTVYFQFSSGN